MRNEIGKRKGRDTSKEDEANRAAVSAEGFLLSPVAWNCNVKREGRVSDLIILIGRRGRGEEQQPTATMTPLQVCRRVDV
jgi:hypothetical protein